MNWLPDNNFKQRLQNPLRHIRVCVLQFSLVGMGLPQDAALAVRLGPRLRDRNFKAPQHPLTACFPAQVLKDETRRCFVGFLPRTLGGQESQNAASEVWSCSWDLSGKEVCASFFEKALQGAEWIQPAGPNGPIPRKTAWMVFFECDCAYRLVPGKEAVGSSLPKLLAPTRLRSHRGEAPAVSAVDVHPDALGDAGSPEPQMRIAPPPN